jgi:hypothetical protein
MKRAGAVVVLCLAILISPAALAGSLLLDQGRQVNGLWVFPQAGAPERYVYLPSGARIVKDGDGRPQFSFVFYTSRTSDAPAAAGSADVHSITAADGGATMHFLVEYYTPEDQVAKAETDLKRLLNRDVRITGAAVFDDGQYLIISSSVGGAGAVQPEMLALKKAPVLEGNRIAISLPLSSKDAAVLLETFRTNTPDLSITFDMSFSGVTDAYDAEMLVDWHKVKESYGYAAGAQIYFIGLKAEASIEKLLQNGSITLHQTGSDAPSQTLVEAAQAKILDLLFAPVEVDKVPEDRRGGLLEALSAMVSGRGALASGTSTGFGLTGAFQLKQINSDGSIRLDFATRARVSRRATLTVNAGDLYQRYGSDPRYFLVTDLTADLQRNMRQVFVEIDGNLAPEFSRFVNNVEVTLRKQHEDGRETLQSVIVNRGNAALDHALGPMTYGAAGDVSTSRWLQYEYRTKWNFYGGTGYETPPVSTNSGVILLAAPFHRVVVHLDGDVDKLRANNVRAVDVRITSRLFEIPHTVTRNSVISSSSALALDDVELVLPEGVYDYDYEVVWTLRDGQQRRFAGNNSVGTLFIDNM